MKNLDTNKVLCGRRDSLPSSRRTGTMHHLYLLVPLMLVLAAHGVLPLAIDECRGGGSVNIRENTATASFTCSGLIWWNYNMYWTILRLGETSPSTVGNCLNNNNRHSCTIVSTYTEFFTLARPIDGDTAMLYFNDLQFIDGATVYCNQVQAGTTQSASCTIQITNLFPRSINQCRYPHGNVEIPENAVQPFFTCSGLWWTQNMSWTIQPLNQPNPTEIGNCLTNINGTFSRSYVCMISNPALTGKFNMTRSADGYVSTLFFKDLQFTNGARISCNQQLSSGPNSTSCKVQVIEPYKLQECQNGAVEVAVNGSRNITCTGLLAVQSMDWIVTLGNGVKHVMNCNNCPTFCNCTIVNNNLRASRGSNSTQLTLYDNNGDLDGALVTCVKRDKATQDQCQVNAVVPYKLRNCENNTIELHENNQRKISCDGPNVSHPIYWTIVYHNGNVKRFDCTAIVNSSVNCQPGDDPRISLFKSATANYLAVTDNNRDLDGAVVTCSSPGNVSMAQCRIRVTWKPSDLMLDNSSCPALVKAGSDVACRCSLPSNQLGSPPGSVVWFTPSGAEASVQQNGSGYSVLHVRSVTAGSVFSCRAVWGQQNEIVRELIYTFEVVEDQASQATTAPDAAIAGGVAGAGVLLIIIIVVVIVIVRRRGSKRDRPKQNTQSQPGPSRNSDELVEFVNDGYMSADQFDGDGRLRAAAATSSADGGGVYSNADAMDTNDTKTNAQNQNARSETAGNDVYAQVQKKPKGVVNKQDAKKPKGDKKVKAEKPAKGVKSRDAENAKRNDTMGENIYASGTDPSEYYNVSALANMKKDNSGDVYMNVSENSPCTRDGATPGAGADDGVYNELNEQADRRNPTYNRTT